MEKVRENGNYRLGTRRQMKVGWEKSVFTLSDVVPASVLLTAGRWQIHLRD